jgi:hypothetical protein
MKRRLWEVKVGNFGDTLSSLTYSVAAATLDKAVEKAMARDDREHGAASGREVTRIELVDDAPVF